ncbi:unnamed protein product [Mortierella alpina]
MNIPQDKLKTKRSSPLNPNSSSSSILPADISTITSASTHPRPRPFSMSWSVQTKQTPDLQERGTAPQ